MKGIICSLLALSCISCATIKTIAPEANHVDINQNGKKSYCESIPRIYSGVSYNFCLLNGEPSKTANYSSLNGVPFFVFDTAFSLVTDTVVLPYTIIKQSSEGSIRVN